MHSAVFRAEQAGKGGSIQNRKIQVRKALDDALKVLKVQQGDDMSAWTVDAWMITFSELGLGGVDPIPWQNRGTHNQVIEILSKAPNVAPEPPPT